MSSQPARKGAFPRPKARSQQPQDDTQQVRELRANYSDKLEMIRELFPTWTDEDLLFALQDAGGEIELAVGRISEGHVEQFSSVKSKKTTKKETPAPVNGSSGWNATPSNAPVSSTTSIRGGRGNHVGAAPAGRGRGGAAVRGARGGRGGFRGAVGGRGGGIAPPINGHSSKSLDTDESTTAPSFAPIQTPTSGTSWADALSKKANGFQKDAASAQASLPPVSSDFESVPQDLATDYSYAEFTTTQLDTAVPATAADDDDDVQEAVTTTGALVSATFDAIPAVKVPASSKTISKGTTMSWAQIARKTEAPKPAVAVPPQAPAAPAQPFIEPQTEAIFEPEQAHQLDETEPVSFDNADVAAEQANDLTESINVPQATEPEPVAADTLEPQVDNDQLQNSEFVESVPSSTVVQESATAASSAIVPPGLNAKSSQRGFAPRAFQRARQDAPVVMPGGASQLDKLGVQFGTLSFLGGENQDANDETSSPHRAALEQPVDEPSATVVAQAAATSRAQPTLHDRLAQSQAIPAQQQTATPSQPQETYSQPAQAAGYNGFKSDAFDASSYNFASQQSAVQQQPTQVQHATQPQQTSQEPVAAQSAPQDQLHGYNGFNSLSQAQQAQAQAQQTHSQSQVSQPQPGLQDYSSMYGGLDTQRLAHFYQGYDQTTNSLAQRAEDKSQSQQQQQVSSQQQQQAQQQQQQQSVDQQQQQQHSGQHHHHHQHQAQATAPGLHQQQAPQQQFHGIMPYYYPHYYMPNQFQHYAQPAAGYGQYPMYGQPAGQPQHPTKPGTPANIASPYSQAGPQAAEATAYGGQSHYAQTPSTAGMSASYDVQGFGRGMQAMPALGGMSDYSKLYGANPLPGLSGFLGSASSAGAPPSQAGNMGAGAASTGSATAGTPHLSQSKAGASTASALDNYRQFDANAAAKAGAQASGAGQVNRSQGQSQTNPQQQQAQQHQQQQQQYYQQYGTYAGHQANTSASYGNYPYARQYWG